MEPAKSDRNRHRLTNRPPVWLGYCRVSSHRQRDVGTSLESQRSAIEAAAAGVGATVEWFIEAASGADPSRSEILRLRRAIRQGLGDAVVVARIDRLSRSQAELLTVLEEIKAAGLTFRSLDLGLDTGTPIGEFVLQVLAGVAQLDRSYILDRTAEGVERRWEQGVWVRGQVPTGYRKSKAGLLMPDPELALAVIKIKEEFAGGMSGEQIAALLNSEGVPSPKGVRWSRSVIYEILDVDYSGGQHPRHPHVHMPAITSPQLERRVRRNRRERQGHSTGRRHDLTFLARGRSFCAACGGRLYASIDSKTGEGTYWCKNRYGLSRCAAPRVKASDLHSRLEKGIHSITRNPRAYIDLVQDSLSRIQGEIEKLESGLPDVADAIARDRKRLERYALTFSEGAISEEKYRERAAPVARRIADMESRRSEDLDALAELDGLRLLKASGLRELEQAEKRAAGLLPSRSSFDPDAPFSEDQVALYGSAHAPLPSSGSKNERLKGALDKLDARVEVRANGGVTIIARMPVSSYKESSGSSSE